MFTYCCWLTTFMYLLNSIYNLIAVEFKQLNSKGAFSDTPSMALLETLYGRLKYSRLQIMSAITTTMTMISVRMWSHVFTWYMAYLHCVLQQHVYHVSICFFLFEHKVMGKTSKLFDNDDLFHLFP